MGLGNSKTWSEVLYAVLVQYVLPYGRKWWENQGFKQLTYEIAAVQKAQESKSAPPKIEEIEKVPSGILGEEISKSRVQEKEKVPSIPSSSFSSSEIPSEEEEKEENPFETLFDFPSGKAEGFPVREIPEEDFPSGIPMDFFRNPEDFETQDSEEEYELAEIELFENPPEERSERDDISSGIPRDSFRNPEDLSHSILGMYYLYSQLPSSLDAIEE